MAALRQDLLHLDQVTLPDKYEPHAGRAAAVAHDDSGSGRHHRFLLVAGFAAELSRRGPGVTIPDNASEA